MIDYLATEHASLDPSTRPPRVAMIQYFLDTPKIFLQAKVDLRTGNVFDQQHLQGRHSYVDASAMQEAEHACLADPRIQAEISHLDLPEKATVIVEPWTYGTDGTNDMANKIIMVSKS